MSISQGADESRLDPLERLSLRVAASLDAGEVVSVATRGLVDDFGAALARVWLVGPGDRCAECVMAPECSARGRCTPGP